MVTVKGAPQSGQVRWAKPGDGWGLVRGARATVEDALSTLLGELVREQPPLR